MAKRFGKSKIKLTEEQIMKVNAKFSSRSVAAKIANKKKKKKTARAVAVAGGRTKAVVSSGGGGDPYFANVVYLVNATGTVDGTPSLYASDVKGNALSANNGLAGQAHDGITKFADFAMEGNGGVYFISGTNSITGGTLGAGEYTIECWCYPVENGNFEILSTRTDDIAIDGGGIGLVRRNTGELMVIRGNGTEVTSGTTFNDNAWNHIAVTRDSSNVTRAYVNGVKGLEYTDSRNYSQQGITILDAQAISGATGARWKGYVEDVRITKGVARYTENTLTVPTAAFPTS